MSRTIRIAVPLLAALLALAWVADRVVAGTGRGWFERDVALRARLAVAGARGTLAAHWVMGEHGHVAALLEELAHDERILAAAACGALDAPLATTAHFPAGVSCGGAEVAESALAPDGLPAVVKIRGGPTALTAVPISAAAQPLGHVVLVHDLAFVERRVAKARWFSAGAFGLLALLATGASLLITRQTLRSWTGDVRRALLGGEAGPPEFRPFLQDVRALVDRLVSEADGASPATAWGPERLQQVLHRHLRGEKVIVVANREPYMHDRGPDGTVRVLHPASGLVTALEPVMRACSGTWIAHGSGSADRETADADGRVRVPPNEGSYWLRRVWLGPDEEAGYYYGLANEGLWPLCHIAHVRPEFRRSDWGHYRTVNRRFAEAVVAEVDREDPVVLVQDYHFAVLPALLRQRLPRATILAFWHIPWPNAERFGISPWCKELLEGMLGASILGFHTQAHCNNFLEAVDRYLEARIDRDGFAVVQRGHRTLVRPYPISLEWPSRWAAMTPPAETCRAELRRTLGLAPDALVGVGVDRLDYTKGIEERLLAVERLLERRPELRGRFTFVQLAAPSRTAIPRYRDLQEAVERTAARISQRFGRDGWRPVVLLREHHEPPAVFRAYRAADLCYVSSLHDGMNLVAKEFVAARDDEDGVLVLSRFTGAARELTEALIVNPYDLDEASAALEAALAMPPEERRARMRSMRALVRELNVYRWAGRMLTDAALVRERDRIASRSSGPGTAEGAA